MRKSMMIWCSTILFGVSGIALAGGQQDMPAPPVQSAEPHNTAPADGKGDYLEKQPDQNNATPRKDAGDMKQDRKVKQPGQSHQKKPDGGGVDVK
jgi:hypothetical protein